MMRIYNRMLFIYFLFIFPGIVFSQLSGTYTIGSGGDYASFSDAASDLNTLGVSGSVEFNVLSGSYTEQFALGTISGASASNTVTFQPQSGNAADVTLSYNASSTSDNYIVQMDGSDFVTFSQLSFNATGSSYARIFDLRNDVDNLTIYQCSLTGNATTSSSTSYALIFGDDLTGNDIMISDNTFTDGSSAAYLQGFNSSSRASGLTIENNDVSGDLYYGFYLRYINNSAINQNMMDIRNYAMYMQDNDGRVRVENNQLQTRLSYAFLLQLNGSKPRKPASLLDRFSKIAKL